MPLTKLAFGVEPSWHHYSLRLARYKALAETVRDFCAEIGATADRPLRLLDVGVGRGRSLRYIAAEGAAERVRFHGVDISPERLAAIPGRAAWRLARADILRGLPFEGASFDLVICEQVLEHLREPTPVVAELARVLRPGGLLILGVPTFPPGISHLRSSVVQIMERGFGVRREHLQTFHSGSARALVRRSGQLQVVECRGFRVAVGGVLGPLEDRHWWYRFNRWLGRLAPSLCIEVQVIARRIG